MSAKAPKALKAGRGPLPDNRLRQPLGTLLADAALAALGDWARLVRAWRDGPAGRTAIETVDRRLAEGAVIYPARPLRAFELTPLARTRVVIVGQDPYHGPGQAEGLAFSVPAGVAVPPSLRNIVREVARDLGLPAPPGGSLVPWAERGVLLLNTAFTVEDGRPASHARCGWAALAEAAVAAAAAEPRPKVFMLWGAHAQAQAVRIDAAAAAGGSPGRHLVLQCNHPSPLSATRGPVPFVGCGHFGAAARFLESGGGQALDWSLQAR